MPALRVVEAFDRRPAAARQDPLQTGLGGIRQKQAIARQGTHQMVELRLDRRQIGEDVGMIELEVVQDRRSRGVVDELRSLVAESAIVFVGFNHKERRVLSSAGQPRRNAEVPRHAADQEAGTQAGMLENPRQHGGRRGLAVRPGDGQHPASFQDMLGQPLRPREIRQTAVEDLLEQRIGSREIALPTT
jgi:hypothetical protein